MCSTTSWIAASALTCSAGRGTVAALEDLVVQMAQAIRPSGIRLESGVPEILSVFGEEIFINVGSGNGVQRGYRFAVYPGRERDGAPGRKATRQGGERQRTEVTTGKGDTKR